ncbi:MAG: fumarylacetoacetate hydrolase family protein [Verrucomicrobiae bacterium]|nr:fumarylacetoacetate hydrolase family protein [Verrucomicrobiae bacterium]
MKLCRFRSRFNPWPAVGLLAEDAVQDLTGAGVTRLTSVLELPNLPDRLRQWSSLPLRRLALSEVDLLPPVERQEVWAAGVTYLRSKKARMEESDFSATAYDRVYEAPRPEIFFKSAGEKVVGPGEPVGIRSDARWSVPEPELALVINSRGELAGYTVGNDMSSRDIEGENLLYLPQAKVYRASCALGPCITVGASEAAARDWTITLRIERGGETVFQGETRVSQIKRSFSELIEWLWRSQEFPQGAILLTGTGVVPPNEFTLAGGDAVRIVISGIGELSNPVAVV